MNDNLDFSKHKNVLYIHNTYTGKKEIFRPINAYEIKMYSCGPTVYDTPHIGNFRAIIFSDLLFRTLKYLYGNVIYARNITDVDDKILKKSKDIGKDIKHITSKYIAIFRDNCKFLRCLDVTYEPMATQYIEKMQYMVERLLNNGFAYVAVDGSVYFDVSKYKNYGALSNIDITSNKDDYRITSSIDKKNKHDFVLWKITDEEGYNWDSKWGKGRPGWHLECSTMSTDILGENFDIHCGGIDLIFPHHENEIAQSVCANKNSGFANYWMHNGFITINGKKMSKSLGNIITIESLKESGLEPRVIRYAILHSHYRKPMDWNNELIQESKNIIDKIDNALIGFLLNNNNAIKHYYDSCKNSSELLYDFFSAICDDLNFPKSKAVIDKVINEIHTSTSTEHKLNMQSILYKIVKFLSIEKTYSLTQSEINQINELMEKRLYFRQRKMYKEADEIKLLIEDKGVKINDSKNHSSWEEK